MLLEVLFRVRPSGTLSSISLCFVRRMPVLSARRVPQVRASTGEFEGRRGGAEGGGASEE